MEPALGMRVVHVFGSWMSMWMWMCLYVSILCVCPLIVLCNSVCVLYACGSWISKYHEMNILCICFIDMTHMSPAAGPFLGQDYMPACISTVTTAAAHMQLTPEAGS